MSNERHSYWSNGIYREFIDGVLRAEVPKQNGTARWWHPNGQLEKESPVVNGVTEGLVREWHENGQLKRETPFRRGNVDGVVRQWNDQGRLLGEYELRSGKGIMREWNNDGSLELELEIIAEGCHRGTIYDDRGRARQVFLWNGRPVSKKKFLDKFARHSGEV